VPFFGGSPILDAEKKFDPGQQMVVLSHAISTKFRNFSIYDGY
jgi:cephalosporin hydroxylase